MAYYSDYFSTTGITKDWSNDTFENDPTPWGFVEKHLRFWMGEMCDPQLGTIIAGSGYQDGTYTNVELKRVASSQTGGEGMLATVEIAGGGVSSVTITRKGNGFKTGDYLTVPNLAQVGGTGGGFQIEVTSADASIGFVYPASRAIYPTYMINQMIGFNRGDSYRYGQHYYRTSSTSTVYNYGFYNHTPSTSNNNYGNWSNQITPQVSFWFPGNGDGYEIGVWYSDTPGNRFFFWSSSVYDQPFGFVETIQPPNPDTDYAETDDYTQWVSLYASSSVTVTPQSQTFYNTSYSGFTTQSMYLPNGSGVLFGGHPIYGYAYFIGYMPPGVRCHSNATTAWRSTLIDGADVYRRLCNTLWVKEA